MTSRNRSRHGGWRYWIAIMGTPSPSERWFWQLDGHHVLIKGIVLRNRSVPDPANEAPPVMEGVTHTVYHDFSKAASEQKDWLA